MRSGYDVIVVGMGPAGLAASARLGESGRRFAMIDAGKSVAERDRFSPHEITAGHGGAGLFSDGKFSFFPSASELWSLPHRQQIKSAYAWTRSTLSAAGLHVPPFPSVPKAYTAKSPGVSEWMLKDYPCDYLGLEERLQLVEGMVSQCKGDIYSQWQVEDIRYLGGDDLFVVKLRHESTGDVLRLMGRRLIVATGRLGPLQASLRNLTSHHRFRRLETGFRIEQASDKAFFRNMKQLDPKLRILADESGTEWRTFCVCREGETCLTETQGLWTVSGHSDCAATGLSNCGFNTRVFDKTLARDTADNLMKRFGRHEAYFRLSMHSLLEGDPETTEILDGIYGQRLRLEMTKGLQRLVEGFKDLAEDADAQLIGPTLEGVGWYPEVDEHLRLVDAPAWVAGDACGLFRGIVAAMISGHYAASAVVGDLQRDAAARSDVFRSPASADLASVLRGSVLLQQAE